MVKISSRGLYIGDPHFQSGTVSSRKDIYLDSISTKFQEALEIARDRELEYVVILGDLFDVAEPISIVRNKVIEILLHGNNSKKWPFDIFAVVGNHDIHSHNIKTINRTALKTLQLVGLIQICDMSEKYGIYFGHYQNNIETKKVITEMPIIAIHSNIVPNFTYNSIMVKDFEINSNNKLVISGHYHNGYDIIEREAGVFFANPGSLGRISSDDINHDIKVAMVELKNNNIENIEYILLKSAQRADLIFDIETINARKQHKIDIDEFINSISKAKISINKESDIISSIKQFGIETKTEEEVIEEAIKRVLQITPMEENNNDE